MRVGPLGLSHHVRVTALGPPATEISSAEVLGAACGMNKRKCAADRDDAAREIALAPSRSEMAEEGVHMCAQRVRVMMVDESVTRGGRRGPAMRV